MDREAECFHTQLIDGDGTLNAVGLDNFIKQINLIRCGVSYNVVSIMGPQSSGKSTLLNHLYHTNFKEMDAYQGRSQTTRGIWIARCVGIEPCTMVMDLEGTDGIERGEDNVFEKQSALFALAVSDIVLINIWCHDIGREHAANKPLLKAVFEVMLKLFSPRKTTLMFVIRDKTKTPHEELESFLRKDIQKIWDSIPKPKFHKQTPLSEFFNFQVVSLSNYEEKEEQFKEQVVSLRQKLFYSTAPSGLAGDKRGVVPASGFSFSTQQIWKDIKENKDLDLPRHKVMVAIVRCDEIGLEKYTSFVANKKWIELQEAVQSHIVPDFGNKLSSLIHNCVSSYNEEANDFEDSVRSAKQKQLEEKLLQLVQPTYQLMFEQIRSRTFDNFKKALTNALSEGQEFAAAARDCIMRSMRLFSEQCEDTMIEQMNWDWVKVKDKCSQDIDSHVAEVRSAKLSELNALYKSKLKEALCGPVEALLERGSDDSWPAIRKLFLHETEKAVLEFSSVLSGFEMEEQAKEDMISNLKNYGGAVVEEKTTEVAGKILYLMKERFTYLFNHDKDIMPRVWTGKEDIRVITKTAWSNSLKLLSVLAAIRLDGDTDKIYDILVNTLMDPKIGTSAKANSQDPLALSTWEEVPASKALITPIQCKLLWNQFQRETEDTITKVITYQEENKRNNKKLKLQQLEHVVATFGVANQFLSNANQFLSNAIQIWKLADQ